MGDAKVLRTKLPPGLAPQPRKYRNVPAVYGGVRYDSKMETRRAAELDMLVRTGDLRFWVRQITFRLGCPENKYVADFLVVGRHGKSLVGGPDVWAEDVKGVRTPKFDRDVKLWRAYGPCPLRIIGRKSVEIVHPRSLLP
jgi:hypothetical protein